MPIDRWFHRAARTAAAASTHRATPPGRPGRRAGATRRNLAALATLLAATGAPLGTHAAPTLQAVRAVEVGQPQPGNAQTFAYLYPGRAVGDRLVFQGWNVDFTVGGLHTVPVAGGAPSLLVGTATPVPGGGGAFFGLLNRSECQDTTAQGEQVFLAAQLSSSAWRVPLAGGTPRRLADTTTPYPDGPVNGSATLRQACRLAHDGSAMVFDTGGFQDGVYRVLGVDTLERVASPLQPYAGGPCAVFTCATFQEPTADQGRIAYIGANVFGPQAVLLGAGAQPLASTQDEAPGSGGGRFFVPVAPSIAGTRVAFRAQVAGGTAGSLFGLYQVRVDTGALSRVLDANTPVPGRPDARWTVVWTHQAVGRQGVLFNAGTCPVDASGQCTAGPTGGIYLACGTRITPVVLDGQVIDGRTVRVDSSSLGGAVLRTEGSARVLRWPLLSSPAVPSGVALYAMALSGVPASCL